MEVFFLLQAMNKEGNLVAIWNLNKNSWKLQKEKNPLYCPQCHEKVIAKFGQLRTPHFAHSHNSSCSHRGESDYHEKGKKDLYEWLIHQGLHPKLEFYLPKTKQRADIFLQIGEKRIAIEYQCATISTEEIITRTKGYQQQQVTPIWILGANRLKRIHEMGIHLNKMDQSFIHQYHPQYPLTLYFYCSETNHFILLQHCIFFSQTKIFGTFIAKPLKQVDLFDLFHIYPLNAQKLEQAWNKEKSIWRNRPVPFHNLSETKWRKWLYQHQLSVHQLPPFVYLPISGQFRMKEQPWRWQSELFVKLIFQKRAFSLTQAKKLMERYYLPINHYPLINQSPDPTLQYLQLLVKREILIEQNGVFKRKENI